MKIKRGNFRFFILLSSCLFICITFQNKNIKNVAADFTIASPACQNSFVSTSNINESITPMIESSIGQTEDSDWPIIAVEEVNTSDSLGRNFVSTITIRQRPHQPLPKAVSRLTASTDYCTYDSAKTYTKSTSTADGGITQNLKIYYKRYIYTNGGSYYSYHVYRTDVWFTRKDSSYTLGQNTTTWNYLGTDCYGSSKSYSKTGGMVPTWSGNSTPLYYWTFMNNWSTLSPYRAALINETKTLAYHSGSSLPTITTKISLSATGY